MSAGPHALRLTPRRMCSIERLHRAGPDGLALVDADDPLLLTEWGLAECFTDATRILSHRVRLTAHGTRCARTLVITEGASP
jgi:hypothetical protein